MAIAGLTPDQFKKILSENLTPARAINSPEHLRGREKMLMQIERAFNSPGKHIFIFGDRGVGKTSLALTAASLHQSSDASPINVSCGSNNFLNVVRDAVKQTLPAGDTVFQRKIEQRLRAGIAGFGYDFVKSLQSGTVPHIESVNDAVSLLRFISEFHSKSPIIVFDEFDRIPDQDQRKICADIIKQVSDTGVNVRFIFCGIGSSVEELLDVHLSTGRYISPIALERLTHDARWEIVESAAKAVGVEIAHNHRVRIGQISDGFPSYIHLITEQILWSMFDDEDTVEKCLQSHFQIGVSRAVEEAETTLKIIYDKATQKYGDDYQEVLWALADDHLLRRQTTSVYEKSYLRIMEQRSDRKKLTKTQFSGRLNNLKNQRHGCILVGKGAGWYEFKENIVRGYVRLLAERAGIQLGVEGVG
jgi:Cdc6-like AAA superfamily ATPase